MSSTGRSPSYALTLTFPIAAPPDAGLVRYHNSNDPYNHSVGPNSYLSSKTSQDPQPRAHFAPTGGGFTETYTRTSEAELQDVLMMGMCSDAAQPMSV